MTQKKCVAPVGRRSAAHATHVQPRIPLTAFNPGCRLLQANTQTISAKIAGHARPASPNEEGIAGRFATSIERLLPDC